LPIRAILESAECEKPTDFFQEDGVTLITSLPENLTKVIETKKGPAIAPALYFRPEQDGNYECKITYSLTNGEKNSTNVFVFKFRMLPVNDAPRLIDTVNFVVPENRNGTVTVSVVDPEGDPVTAQVTGCQKKGNFTINGKLIQCPEVGAPVDIPMIDDKINVTFSSPSDDTSGDNFNAITIQVSDGQNTSQITIPVNVVEMNSPPTIYCGEHTLTPVGLTNQSIDEVHGAAKPGDEISICEFIFIQDEEAKDLKPLFLVVTWTGGNVSIRGEPLIMGNRQGTNPNAFGFGVGNGEATLTATAKEINEIMNTMTWSSDKPTATETLTIVVDDQGVSGSCLNTEQQIVTHCPQKAILVAHLSVGRSVERSNLAKIITPTVIAAAAVAAAAAAAGAGLLFGGSQAATQTAATVAFAEEFNTMAQASSIFEGASVGGTNPGVQ